MVSQQLQAILDWVLLQAVLKETSQLSLIRMSKAATKHFQLLPWIYVPSSSQGVSAPQQST